MSFLKGLLIVVVVLGSACQAPAQPQTPVAEKSATQADTQRHPFSRHRIETVCDNEELMNVVACVNQALQESARCNHPNEPEKSPHNAQCDKEVIGRGDA